ncbi:MAG: hypothetical protein QXL17_06510 [Candidatus Thermoplasmatota archaeon]
MSQADLLQYLKEHVLPDTFDVSGANTQRVLQFAGEAVEHYFEGIQDDFSDVDMMSTGDKIDILQDLDEIALSTIKYKGTGPRTARYPASASTSL